MTIIIYRYLAYSILHSANDSGHLYLSSVNGQKMCVPVEGKIMHERVHNPNLIDYDSEHIVVRSYPLVCHGLGIHGQADMVEFWPVEDDGAGGVSLPGRRGLWKPKPVEYKRGRPKRDDRDKVQLCAQALCLEEMLGTRIAAGDLFTGRLVDVNE